MRPQDSINPGNSSGSAGTEGRKQKLADIRQKSDGLLRAAQNSIEKALSGNSQSFLEQGRQQGGQ